jgi:EmrB/QacA subfamily drug resistance transporter
MSIGARDARADRSARWVLGLASAGSFVVVLDMLVVATALTTIQRDLGASIADLEWTVNAYNLSCAVLLMTASALGDRFGRRRVFGIGLGVFAAASAACALAPSVGVLVAARAVQGAGAAAVLPLGLALLNAAYPPERRGWAVGIYGSVTGLAAAVGPVLGGAVTQGIAWQWIFWVNVPVAAAAVAVLFARVPESRGPRVALDVPGLILVTAAAFGLVWGLVRGNSAGWLSVETVAAIGGGIAMTGAFIAWERRAPAPMLAPRLFRSRGFSASAVATFMLNGALVGAVFFTAQYLQVADGDGPLAAGLRLLTWGIAPVIVAPRAGAWSDRIGVRPLMVTGLALQAVGLAWLAAVAGRGTSYLELLGPMAVAGVGFSMAIPAITKSIVSSVPIQDVGKASATYAMMRQLGGAFGVAILAAAFARTGGYESPHAFADGFAVAIAVGASLAAAGAIASLAVPAVRRATAPAAVGERAAAPATVDG